MSEGAIIFVAMMAVGAIAILALAFMPMGGERR